MARTSRSLAHYIYPVGLILSALGAGAALFLQLPAVVNVAALVVGVLMVLGKVLYDAIASLPSYAILSEKIIYGFTVVLTAPLAGRVNVLDVVLRLAPLLGAVMVILPPAA